MKLRQSFLALGTMILGVGLFGAFPQQAKADSFGGITCTPQNNGVYPSDGTHFFMCISSPTGAQTTRMQGYYQTINGFYNAPNGLDGARDKLKTAGTSFYFFKNRTQHNSYMGAKYGSPFQSTTARCGNTHSQLGTIVSSVFDSCAYTGGDQSNANVKEVAKHEAGHAWSAALGKINGTSGPARSTGFLLLVDEDKTRFDDDYTAASTPALKKTYICGVFGNVGSSTLELNLGADNATPVCTGGGASAVLNYPGKTPTQIANLKLPYFITGAGSPVYEEWWAEMVVKITGGSGSPDMLPITNKYLFHANALCTNYAMNYMWTHGVAPAQSSYPNACVGVAPNILR